jgi:hypothetical protein
VPHMLRAVFIVAVGAVVAAFFVPFQGKTLWERVERHAFPYAVRSLRGTPSKPKKSAAAPAVQGRRDRIVPEKPKEKLTGDDRAALNRLVSTRAR